jgi:murein DD-endopeptidase MepM/ murein hydrolase activator NlpD
MIAIISYLFNFALEVDMKRIYQIIVTIIGIVFIVENIIFIHFLKKMNSIHVLTTIQDSLYVSSPLKLEKGTILLSTDYINRFSQYRSPFGDSLSFQTLINNYIRNRNQDHYGSARGTKSFQRIHEGIDLFVPENTPLYPLAAYGIVTEVSDDPFYLFEVEGTQAGGTKNTTKIEYGKTVRILYPEGIESIYTHLNEVYVILGQEVGFNTVVGLTGRTGNVRNSGKPSHLHLELRDFNNRSFDPRNRLHFNQSSIDFFLKHLKIKE